MHTEGSVPKDMFLEGRSACEQETKVERFKREHASVTSCE